MLYQNLVWSTSSEFACPQRPWKTATHHKEVSNIYPVMLQNTSRLEWWNFGVSWKGGTPKSSILLGCSWIFHYKLTILIHVGMFWRSHSDLRNSFVQLKHWPPMVRRVPPQLSGNVSLHRREKLEVGKLDSHHTFGWSKPSLEIPKLKQLLCFEWSPPRYFLWNIVWYRFWLSFSGKTLWQGRGGEDNSDEI